MIELSLKKMVKITEIVPEEQIEPSLICPKRRLCDSRHDTVTHRSCDYMLHIIWYNIFPRTDSKVVNSTITDIKTLSILKCWPFPSLFSRTLKEDWWQIQIGDSDTRWKVTKVKLWWRNVKHSEPVWVLVLVQKTSFQPSSFSDKIEAPMTRPRFGHFECN